MYNARNNAIMSNAGHTKGCSKIILFTATAISAASHDNPHPISFHHALDFFQQRDGIYSSEWLHLSERYLM